MESQYSKERGSENCLLKIRVKDNDGKHEYELVIMNDGEKIILLIHNERLLKLFKETEDQEDMEFIVKNHEILNEEIIGVNINHSQALKIASVLTGHVEEFMFDDMIEYTQSSKT
jgi:hypothetical protein